MSDHLLPNQDTEDVLPEPQDMLLEEPEELELEGPSTEDQLDAPKNT